MNNPISWVALVPYQTYCNHEEQILGTHDIFKKRQANANKDFRQKSKEKEPRITILIVTEGEKTEKNYLEALKKYLEATNTHIIIDPKSDPTPSNVVNYAIKKKGGYDYIYCLIDRDMHDKDDFKNALKEAQKNNLISIVSDPCFEYWILLHFTYITKQFGQGELSPCNNLIDEHLLKYINKDKTKNQIDKKTFKASYNFTDTIKHRLKTAIQNAKIINKINEENKKIEERKSPYTQVIYLVEKLQKLAKDSTHIVN